MRDEWDPGNTCFRMRDQIQIHLKTEPKKITMQVIQQSSPARSGKSRRNELHFWRRKSREDVETAGWRRSGNGEQNRQGKH